jgi:uncharacterized MAPEG superfamily protein
MKALTAEMYWLTATTAMTGLFWVPYILNRMKERGVLAALWDPHGDTRASAAWADRMMRAHRNAVENLCVFAPLVLTLHAFNLGTPVTAAAAMAYFFARAAHFIIFTAGLPVLRVLAFVAGFACQAVIAAAILTAA